MEGYDILRKKVYQQETTTSKRLHDEALTETGKIRYFIHAAGKK